MQTRHQRTMRPIRLAVVVALLSSAVVGAAQGQEGSSQTANGYVASIQSYTASGTSLRISSAMSSCAYDDFLFEESPGNWLWDYVQEYLMDESGEPTVPVEDLTGSHDSWGNCMHFVWQTIPGSAGCDPAAQFSFIGTPVMYDFGRSVFVAPPPDPPPVTCIEFVPLTGDVPFHLVDQHPVTAPQVELDPYVRGLVGLDTRSWYDTPASEFASRAPYTDSFAITLPSWIDAVPVTGDLWLEQIRWDFVDGDGEWDYQSNCSFAGATAPPGSFSFCAGSEESPIVTDHQWEEARSFTVTMELQWTGYFDDPNGNRHYFTDTSTLVNSTDRAFDVIEVRSELWARE